MVPLYRDKYEGMHGRGQEGEEPAWWGVLHYSCVFQNTGTSALLRSMTLTQPLYPSVASDALPPVLRTMARHRTKASIVITGRSAHQKHHWLSDLESELCLHRTWGGRRTKEKCQGIYIYIL